MHSIAKYIQHCVKNNIEISPLLPINLTSVEITSQLKETKEFGSKTTSYETTQTSHTLIIDLIKNIPLQHWKHLISTNNMVNFEQLSQAVTTSIKTLNAEVLTELLKAAAQVLKQHIEKPEDPILKKQFNFCREAFVNSLSKNYPHIISYADNENINKEKIEPFFDKLIEINAVAQTLFGSHLAFNFAYSQYPIDLDAALIDDNFISNIKKQVSVITGKPFSLYSFTDKKFEEPLHSVVSPDFLIANNISNFCEMKLRKSPIGIQAINHFISHVSKEKNMISHDNLLSIATATSRLLNHDLLNNSISMRKQTTIQKGNLYSSLFINKLGNSQDTNDLRLPMLQPGKNIDFPTNPHTINFLLDNIAQQNNKDFIAVMQLQPILLLSNKFQEHCESIGSDALISSFNKHKKEDAKKIDAIKAALSTITLLQHLKQETPDFLKKERFNIEKNFSVFENSCDLLKPEFLKLRQHLFANIKYADIKNFFNSFMSFTIKPETIELIILDITSPKHTTSKIKTVKF